MLEAIENTTFLRFLGFNSNLATGFEPETPALHLNPCIGHL